MATTRLTGQALGASITGGLLALGAGDGVFPADLAALMTMSIGLLTISFHARRSINAADR